MVHRSKIVEFTGGIDYFTYSRIAEFDYLSGLHINQVIVLAALECSLELSDVLPELMLCHKITVEQKLYRVIERSTAYPVVFILHEDVERFDIKMAGAGVDLIKNSKSFRRLPVPFSFKIFGKYLLNCLPDIIIHHKNYFTVTAKIAISPD